MQTQTQNRQKHHQHFNKTLQLTPKIDNATIAKVHKKVQKLKK